MNIPTALTNTENTDTADPNSVKATSRSRSWAKIALRWMPTFLGFPAGGFIAEIVGRVDSPVPAIAGGAITGAVLGFAQWLGIRRTGPAPVAWIIATAAGFAAGLGLGAAAAGYDTTTAALATQGAICGAIVGAAQAAVLYRVLGRIVVAWPAVIAGLWTLGWTVTASAGIDVEAQYTSFGSSGALVVTAATSVLPIWLAAHAVRTARARVAGGHDMNADQPDTTTRPNAGSR